MQYALLIYEDESSYGPPDLDAAIAIAGRVPVLLGGAIEIRPVLGPA
jgi:hypothetical protein